MIHPAEKRAEDKVDFRVNACPAIMGKIMLCEFWITRLPNSKPDKLIGDLEGLGC